jgi:hypothetical protein
VSLGVFHLIILGMFLYPEADHELSTHEVKSYLKLKLSLVVGGHSKKIYGDFGDVGNLAGSTEVK